MQLLLPLVSAALTIIAAPSHVIADAVAIEVMVRDVQTEGSSLLAPFFDELASRGVSRWDGELLRRFEERSSLPVRTNAGLRTNFVEAVDSAYKLWLSGEFRECTAALQVLLDEAHSNPFDASADPRVGPAVFKLLVGLSLCHHRLGDEAASRKAMTELLRSFDGEVSKGQFGVEAFELFVRVRSDQKALTSGSLTVRSFDEVAAIFINERFVKVGQASRAGLAPGRYRVFAQVGQRPGRLHLIEVKPGEVSTVDLDPAFEQAVVTASGRGSLVFADLEDRARSESSYATRVGTTVSASMVLVVGVNEKAGKPVVYGAAIDVAKGAELRRASILLGDAAGRPLAMRSLARFLMGDPREAGVEIEGPNPRTALLPSLRGASLRDHETARWGGWKWLFTGTAIAGAGAGATLLLLDGECTATPPSNMRCPNLHDYRLGGLVLSGAGVTLGGIATWLWLSERSARSGETALRVNPTRGGVTAWISVPW